MNEMMQLAEKNMKRAREVAQEAGIVEAWRSISARINLVGSLKMGLLVKHRDIDFHIYSSPLTVDDSFRAVSRIARNSRIRQIQYGNLLHTEEECLEWHAWYEDRDGETWQIDMIHIVEGSRYDGYFEAVSDRIMEALTPETRETILRLKFQTPDTEKIAGIEYYRAVLEGRVMSYGEFARWRRENPLTGVCEWMPEG